TLLLNMELVPSPRPHFLLVVDLRPLSLLRLRERSGGTIVSPVSCSLKVCVGVWGTSVVVSGRVRLSSETLCVYVIASTYASHMSTSRRECNVTPPRSSRTHTHSFSV